MEEFEVSFQGIKQAAQNEESVARELKQMESEINQILSASSVNFSEAVNIRRALQNNLQSVTNTRKKMAAMSTALLEILDLYQSTENKISNNSNVENQTFFDTIQKKTKEMLDKIREISEGWGMDRNAEYSKDPVNLCNGNYVYEKICMELNTEIEMQFRIFYNIQNDRAGSLGRGWIHTWEVALERTEGMLSMIRDDYSRYIFLNENGEFRAAPGTAASFRHQDEYDIVTDRTGISYFFNNRGCLMRIENLVGSYITLEYDDDGYLHCVQDRRGNFFCFIYDESGRLQKVSDSTEREVLLVWRNDRLATVIDPQKRKTSYRYDSHGWLTELINGNGVTCLVNTYDEQGRTICQKFPDGGEMKYRYLDDKGQVILTEQNGNEISYEHDEYMRNTRIIYADSEESAVYDENNNRISMTDRRGNTSYFSYDERGNMRSFRNALGDELTFSYTEKNQISQMKLNGKMLQRSNYNEKNLQVQTENAVGAIDKYEYDEYGQPIVWEKADGSKIKLTYDEKGNLSSITNNAGGCTRYEYNNCNHVIRTIDGLGNETFYSYNDADELVMVKDAAGNTQTYVYDECGNVIRTTDASGAETITEYNVMNKPARVIKPDGSETIYEYDSMWNMIGVTEPDGAKTVYQYDKNQRLVKVQDAEGGVNHMEYDPCGNMTRRIDPAGGTYKLGYDEINRPNYICDPVGIEMRAEYDALGNVTAVFYPDGNVERYEYDLMSHVTMSQDRSGYQKFYEYDILGNLKKVSDTTGILEEYSYYPGGLLQSEYFADGSSRTFYYDCNENVVRIVNQDGNPWEFTYDCLGRVVCARQEQGVIEHYEYDALGNVTAVIDGTGGRISYCYSGNNITSVVDELGNRTCFSYDHCSRLVRIIQSGQEYVSADEINAFNRSQKDIRITDYCYDKKGNLIESIDPEGNKIFYTYDGNNRILSRTDANGDITQCEYNMDGTVRSYYFADGKSVKMSYNPLKQLIQMEDWLGITRIESDTMGHPIQVITPDGEKISYEWGKRGEKKGIIYPDGMKVSYEYDAVQRLSKCSFGKEKVFYQYYPNGKLKEKLLPDQIKIFFQYNAAGNVSEISHIKDEKVLDRLCYQYDANNRKSQISRERYGMADNGIYEYQYNAAGSLISVLKNGSEEECYKYDAYGNRIFSRILGKEMTYAYNRLDQLVSMNDLEGMHTYIYGHRGNLLSEQLNGTVVKDLSFNAQGFLESIKQAGEEVTYQYNGFGNQVGRRVSNGVGLLEQSSYSYDITRKFNHLLGVKGKENHRNIIWDDGALAYAGAGTAQYLFTDERMSPLRLMQNGEVAASMSFDSFGNVLENRGTGSGILGYAGYRPDPFSGFAHVNAREYDARNGRFISRDLLPGMLILPLTLNAYAYALSDPVNYYDPSGLVAAWLAGGIVYSVANIAKKVAGDVVQSVATGKIHVSSWQSYVGTAVGGFTYGTTFVASGGNNTIAKAASGAAETLTTEGLSMLTGAKGYRAEDGYTWKNLVANTVVGGITGGSAGGNAGDYIKVPGINKGKGSFQAVWKQVMTKAAQGKISEITWKTIGKGVIAYGGLHLVDQTVKKGWKKFKDFAVEKGTNQFRRWLTTTLSGNRPSARCALEG